MTLPDLPADLTIKGVEAVLAYKLLGPAAVAMGETFKGLVETASTNVGNVFKNATTKLGSRLDEPGAMSPRALDKLIGEGAFSEDTVVVDYLGGVLASARTPDGKDDRAISVTAQIGRMSRDQLRLHYVLYTLVRQETVGEDINWFMDTEAKRYKTFLSFRDLVTGLALGDNESDWQFRFMDAFYGLQQEDLIANEYRSGDVNHLKPEFPGAREGGMLYTPSVQGLMLYMWGHGHGIAGPSKFTSPGLPLLMDQAPVAFTGSGLCRRLNDEQRDTPGQ